MVSSQILQKLPDTDKLKLISKSIAMLDSIIMPEWEFRYYSFNSKWSNDEEVASMRSGSGEEYIILFNSYGAIIKGRFPEAGLIINFIES